MASNLLTFDPKLLRYQLSLGLYCWFLLLTLKFWIIKRDLILFPKHDGHSQWKKEFPFCWRKLWEFNRGFAILTGMENKPWLFNSFFLTLTKIFALLYLNLPISLHYLKIIYPFSTNLMCKLLFLIFNLSKKAFHYCVLGWSVSIIIIIPVIVGVGRK